MSIETNNMKIGLVIMASGLSKRFGRNKLMEALNGKPLIKWTIDATDALFDRRVVVTRNSDVRDLCDELCVDCIMHEFPNRNDTIRLGLTALMDSVDYCFFMPGDQPLISRQSIINLINEAKKHGDRIIRASFGDTCGMPVGFPKTLFNDLLNLPEKKGGSFVVKNNLSLVDLVELSDKYELFDVDTEDDLEVLKGILKTK